MKRALKGVAVTLAVLGLCGIAVQRKARAQFGIPSVVFDPSSYATLGHIWSQDISNYSKMIQTVVQLEKIYSNALQMYNLSQAMSQSFRSGQKSQWLAVAQMASMDYTQDKYGENKTWSPAVSGNPSLVPNAWKQSTVALSGGVTLANETVGYSPALANLASVEALDGSSTKCLSTVSLYRGTSLANQLGPVMKLAIARMDGSAATNSQIEQLNILAAEQEQGNTESRAQGQIDSCLVEQQVLANKVQRDQIAQNINYDAHLQSVLSNNNNDWNGGTATFRLP